MDSHPVFWIVMVLLPDFPAVGLESHPGFNRFESVGQLLIQVFGPIPVDPLVVKHLEIGLAIA